MGEMIHSGGNHMAKAEGSKGLVLLQLIKTSLPNFKLLSFGISLKCPTREKTSASHPLCYRTMTDLRYIFALTLTYNFYLDSS